MRITRLRLQNVKRHQELDLELAAGLNVVRGPNEAGKSTIQRALEIGLFRKSTSTAQELDDVRRWGAGDEDPVVEISFEDEGVPGVLAKRFAGQRGTVELRTDGATLTDPSEVEQLIVGLTGLPSERFFRATASINHQELVRLDQDEGTLRDRLQQSMSGADRGTWAARRKLEEAARRYRSAGQKNPGYLKVARADVDRLKAAVEEGENALSQLERDRQALAEARHQRAAFDDQLSQYRQAVEATERALALARRADDAGRRYSLYKRAADLSAEIKSMEAAHPSPVALPGLRGAVERARNLEFQLSELRAELAAEPDLSAWDMTMPSPRWRPFALATVVLLVAAIGAALGGLLVDQLVIGLAAGAALLLASLLAGFVTWRRRRRQGETQTRIELREIDVSRRLRGRSDLTDQVRQVERERDQAVAALGLSDLAAAEELLEAEVAHVAGIDNLRAELRGLLDDDQQAEDFVQLRDRAAAESDECRHALSGMGKIGSDPQKSHTAFQAAVQRVSGEREQAIQTEAQAAARLETNTVDAEHVAAQVEAYDVALEQLEATERRLRIYEQVLSTLEEAERSTMKKAARFLEERMATDVEEITDGRYRRLKVDEDKLTFSVFSVERGDWVDVRSLSQGTLDQLYLCARLGIVRQVTQPATPPLILDDPFVTFDADRARRAVQLLKDAASDYQVILLTSSERYDDLADKVIELPRPEQRDERSEEPPAVPADEPVGRPADEPAFQAALDLSAQLGLPLEPSGGAAEANGHSAFSPDAASAVEER
jgi:hypothetical protein